MVPKSDRTIDQLISDINATIVVKLQNHSVTNFITAGVSIQLTKVTNITIINHTSIGLTNNCTSITLDDTTLITKILGFTNKTLTQATGNAAYNVSQLNIDNTLYMRINNIPNANNNQVIPYTFKIPIPSTWSYSQTVYYSDTFENQSISFYSSSSSFLDRFDITIVDKYGFPLTGYYNWSFTLLIEYDDDNNNNTIEFLNIYN